MRSGAFVHRRVCPACGLDDHEVILTLRYSSDTMRAYLRQFYGEKPVSRIQVATEGIDYVLRKCRSCRLIFQEHVPDDDLLSELYEEWLDPTDSALHSQERGLEPRLALQVLEIADHFSRPLREVSILDFGMGWGEFCRVAKGLGCQVAGADLSVARQRAAAELDIPVIDVDDVGGEVFDFVNTEQVFEHLTRPDAVLEKLRPLLAPGGVLRISVPNCVDIEDRLRIGDWTAPKGTKRSLNAVAPLEHVNCYQHESLVALADKVGLRPIHRAWRQVRFSPTWEPPGRAARFAVGRLYRSLRHQDTQIWLSAT